MSYLLWLGIAMVAVHIWWLYSCKVYHQRNQDVPLVSTGVPIPIMTGGDTFRRQVDHYFQNVIPLRTGETCYPNLTEMFREMFEDPNPHVGSRKWGDHTPDVFYV